MNKNLPNKFLTTNSALKPLAKVDRRRKSKLLIAITSARSHYMQRWIIRKTFELDPDFNSNSMSFFFALGYSDNESQESNLTQIRIEDELEKRSDIILFPFVDNYENLSIKTFYIYQEAMKRIAKDELIGKVLFYDDDCIIDIGRIKYHIDKHVSTNGRINK